MPDSTVLMPRKYGKTASHRPILFTLHYQLVPEPSEAGVSFDRVRCAEALKREGNAHFAANCMHEAVRCYSAALELVHAHPVYLTNRALTWFAVGRHDLSLADADAALASDPVRKTPLAYVGTYSVYSNYD